MTINWIDFLEAKLPIWLDNAIKAEPLVTDKTVLTPGVMVALSRRLAARIGRETPLGETAMPAAEFKYYVLRHKRYGTYMPMQKAGQKVADVDPDYPDKQPPRLFATASSAKATLKIWGVGPTPIRGRKPIASKRNVDDWEVLPVSFADVPVPAVAE
jgi:hypothetical protein